MPATTRRAAAAAPGVLPGRGREVRVVALTAGAQRHVYLFREDRADACLASLAAHAADPDHPLTPADAALLRARVLED